MVDNSENPEGRSAEEMSTINFVKVEIAPSNRSECRGCKTKIDKGLIRIGMCFDDGITRSYPWHHLKCFYLSKAYLDSKFEPADIKGFYDLSGDNRLAV